MGKKRVVLPLVFLLILSFSLSLAEASEQISGVLEVDAQQHTPDINLEWHVLPSLPVLIPPTPDSADSLQADWNMDDDVWLYDSGHHTANWYRIFGPSNLAKLPSLQQFLYTQNNNQFLNITSSTVYITRSNSGGAQRYKLLDTCGVTTIQNEEYDTRCESDDGYSDCNSDDEYGSPPRICTDDEGNCIPEFITVPSNCDDNRKRGFYGYHFLYVSEEEENVTIQVRGKTQLDNMHYYGSLQVHVFKLRDDLEPSMNANELIGPLQTLTNGRVGVKFRTTSRDALSNKITLEPGAYLVLLYSMYQFKREQQNNMVRPVYHFEDDQGGLLREKQGDPTNVNNDATWYLTNHYQPDWQNTWFNLDENKELCNHYYSSEDGTGHLASLAPEDVVEAVQDDDPSKLCCGNNATDIGYSEGNYLCTDEGWKYTLLEPFCRSLIPQEKGGPTVFLDWIGMGSQDIYFINDGRDACCGDDSSETGFFENFNINRGWYLSIPTPGLPGVGVYPNSVSATITNQALRSVTGRFKWAGGQYWACSYQEWISDVDTNCPFRREIIHARFNLSLADFSSDDRSFYLEAKTNLSGEVDDSVSLYYRPTIRFLDDDASPINIPHEVSGSCYESVEHYFIRINETECSFTVPESVLSEAKTVQLFMYMYSSAHLVADGLTTWIDDIIFFGPFDSARSYITTNYQDLGSIITETSGIHQNRYLCMNNYADREDTNYMTYRTSGGLWNWWFAESSLFLIHNAPLGDTISNSKEWYTCDPFNQLSDSLAGNLVSNYQTFPNAIPELDPDQQYCPAIPSNPTFSTKPLEHAGVIYDVGNYIISPNCGPDADIQSLITQYLTTHSESGSSEIQALYSAINNSPDHGASHFDGCCYRPARASVTDYGPHKGWSVFIYEDDPSECPMPCYDLDGNPSNEGGNPGGTPEGSDFEDIIKEEWTDHGGWGGIQSLSCSDFAQHTNIPYFEICEGNTVCVPNDGGYFLRTSGGSENCCLRGTCQSPESLTCSEVAGEAPYWQYNPTQSEFFCTGQSYNSTHMPGLGSDVCCIGSVGLNMDQLFLGMSGNQSFVCYQGPQTGMWGECCGPHSCHNFQQYTYNTEIDNPFDKGNTFTGGSALHTFISFDTINDGSGFTRGATDRIRKITISTDGDDVRNVSAPLRLDEHYYSISDYDNISFDMYWTGKYKPIAIYYVYENSLTEEIISQERQTITDENSIIPGQPELLWHRITIPAPEIGIVNRVILEVQNQNTQLVQQQTTTIYLDNFVAHKMNDSDPELPDNDYLNYYCTGSFGTWIDDLNPPSSVTDYAPYQLACDSQMSFGWTGTQCCGSRTIRSDPNEYSLAEYYNDSNNYGCWGGVRIPTDSQVAEVYRDVGRNAEILYYQGGFYNCTQGAENDLVTREVEGVDDTSARVEGVAPFTFMGSWYCDPGADSVPPVWKRTSELSRTRILMSMLYSMAGENFTLHCDDAGDYNSQGSMIDVSPAVNAAFGEYRPTGMTGAHAKCVLVNKTSDGEVERVIVGAVVDYSVPINTFINDSARSFYPFANETFEEVNCLVERGTSNPMPDDLSDPTQFFRPCEGQSSHNNAKLDAYYNRKLHLVYFSIDDVGSSGGFFTDLWNAIIGFFSSLFIGGTSAPDYATPAIGLHLLFEADFQHAYVARQGNLEVKGSVERVGIQSSSTDEYEDAHYERQLRIDYINFSASVDPLREILVAGGIPERNTLYCAGGSGQTIYATIPAGNKFDWRYLTSTLRLNNTGTPGTFDSMNNPSACYLHNGEIDHPSEECDDTYARWRQIVALNTSINNGTVTGLNCSHINVSWDDNILITQCFDGKLDTRVCEPSDIVLFVTSTKYDGNLAEYGGADAICRAHSDSITSDMDVRADQARALISYYNPSNGVTVNARDAFPTWNSAEPYNIINVDNDELASSPDLLFDTPSFNAKSILNEHEDEVISVIYPSYDVWTGSLQSGHAVINPSQPDVHDCADWRSNSIHTTIGGAYGVIRDRTSSEWMNDVHNSRTQCNRLRALYCIVPVGD